MSLVTVLSRFDQTQSIKETIARYLSANDIKAVSLVPNLFNKIINNLVIEPRIVIKPSLPVTTNSKKDLIAYYHQINNEILQDIDPNGRLIERSKNPILQHCTIKNYIKINSEQILKRLEIFLERLIDNGRCTTATFLMTHLPFNHENDHIKYGALYRGYTSIIRILVEQGVVFDGSDIITALSKNQFNVAKFLIETADIKNIREGDFNNSVYFGYCPEAVRAFLVKGFTANQALIDMAQSKGHHEIATILQEFMPPA